MENFDQSLEYVYSRGASNGDHNLEKIKRMLEFFDNPQDKIKTIHIAGTNGKGSTAKMLANVLGKKVKCGIFTSPFMEKINEEISINGVDISDEDFINLVNRLRPFAEKLDDDGYHITYFEFLTAMMYLYFYEKEVDVAVIEVGLGGTLDSTNIIKKPLASVITSISMDHTNILGSSLEEIAENKAGIIKENIDVFSYPQKDQAFKVIEKVAKEKKSNLYTFDKDEIKIISEDENGNTFDFRTYKNIKTKIIGDHQIYNACLTLMVLDSIKNEFGLEEKDIRDGIYETYNPARLDIICKNPRIILDGSHNKESIDALVDSLKLFDYEKLIVGFSVLKDKDHKYIIEKIANKADKLIVTQIDDNPRAMDAYDIQKEAKIFMDDVEVIKDNEEAFVYSKSQAGKNDLIIWCGSLYLVGRLLAFKDERDD
uniref:bifunctional folylpolyglutamate synthase/dihydrofolate synthase n=1 Tax=Anaerococcus mediterraneensis TaxID=1870984 RepID=UPI000AF6B613|nr:folylpolyglutamate synthase/dihydrofolate synthase family protein [Anaerococcus mediterraneensis]